MAQDSTGSGPMPAVRRPISDDSWIEISSQPSSSSLSSFAPDEVVTTGLRLSQDTADSRRRRRLSRQAGTQMAEQIEVNTSASRRSRIRTFYDESEGDSDRPLSSSNEGLQPRFVVTGEAHDDSPLGRPVSAGSDGDSLQDDEDDTGTALGVILDSPIFTPQPNVFSHPPSARLLQVNEDSYFPPLPSSRASTTRPSDSTSSVPSNTNRPIPSRARSHTPYNMIAPGSTVDHDAALRASLSTLLSCAAAARGLHKREASAVEPSRSNATPRVRGVNPTQPTVLRIVPESALGQVEEHVQEDRSSDPPSSPTSLPWKRKSKSPLRDRRKRTRPVHNLRNEDVVQVSPTLTTWVVGAGVLVLFSAISFTAGYTMGKEVGRVDASVGGSGEALNCASEAGIDGISRGLARRSGWRWGNASGVRV